MPPMDDASSVDPNMGADPNMGGDPSMGADPMGGGAPMDGPDGVADPMGGGDQNMNGEMDSEGQMPDDMGGEDMDEKVQEIVDISNGLDDEGKKAILNYARSVKDNKSSGGKESEGPEMGGEPMPDEGGDMPQMPTESIIFTKGQLRKINESFGMTDDDEDKEKVLSKRTEKTIKKVKQSPFNSPRFK